MQTFNRDIIQTIKPSMLSVPGNIKRFTSQLNPPSVLHSLHLKCDETSSDYKIWCEVYEHLLGFSIYRTKMAIIGHTIELLNNWSGFVSVRAYALLLLLTFSIWLLCIQHTAHREADHRQCWRLIVVHCLFGNEFAYPPAARRQRLSPERSLDGVFGCVCVLLKPHVWLSDFSWRQEGIFQGSRLICNRHVRAWI